MIDAATALAIIPSISDRFVEPVRRATLRPTSRGKIVGNHDSIRDVLTLIERVARSHCTVLVTGESGTGKELIVAALHDSSGRAAAPLVTVNCGAIPEALIESELFGHAKGAFTGATGARQGRVAAAEGGTLFLDEIGELPLALQVKILRLLQQREYSMVGDSRVMKCDVRIVAATNRDLEQEVANGRFREDLYYRLNVIHVQLPSLRDRGDDVRVLAESFLRSASERAGRTDLHGFTPEAMVALCSYEWPGNVRALENAIERAALLSRGPVVDVCDLPPRVRENHVRETPSGVCPVVPPLPALPAIPFPDGGINLRAAVEEYENGLIRDALERTGWNKNRAAQLLGLNRTTLVEMVKRKGL
jgi:sigma-54 specific flagellar transcriptional regulator A